MPPRWDGRACVEQMRREGSRHWRQSEWIGWYFQHECERRLADFLTVPGPRFGKVEFDAFKLIPWDFKAHVRKTNRDHCIVNDRAATEAAIVAHSAVGVIIAVGRATYDDAAGSFRQWHQSLAGGESDYTKKRAARGRAPRRRKAAFEVEYFALLRLGADEVQRARSFQRGFRNSDGRPRGGKVMLDLESIPKHAAARCFPQRPPGPLTAP